MSGRKSKHNDLGIGRAEVYFRPKVDALVPVTGISRSCCGSDRVLVGGGGQNPKGMLNEPFWNRSHPGI